LTGLAGEENAMAEMPELTLYNTLTRSKESFTPIDRQNVRMYVCGPTVYDFAHIGNARPVIVFDVLFRLLRHLYGPDHVTYVRNITDVDDKIIDRARRDFPDLDLNAAIAKVTTETADQFHADVKALGCLEPTHEPRATEHIGEMVDIIGKLLANSYAYIELGKNGREVLFDVSKMDDYGKLSDRVGRLDEQVAGARVEVEAHKRNPGDFVLWKESVGDEPGWPATFKPNPEFRSNTGEVEIFGRPGWHIECSAMSKVILGETFDIHGGGIDLVFPHHENEIAQSRCAHGTDVMANVWMHNGFLQVEGQKMSKSLGNFVTIHELLNTETFGERSWSGEVLRLAMLMTKYNQPIDFTARRLDDAAAQISRFRRLCSGYSSSDEIDAIAISALCDDLNAKKFFDRINVLIRDHAFQKVRNLLEFIGLDPDSTRPLSNRTHHLEAGHIAIQGHPIKLLMQDATGNLVLDKDGQEYLSEQVTARLAARAEKNWAEADRIRDELAEKGILLKDGKDPETGEPVTTWEPAR
jgi:cysteinyl-tRNA synthetase